MIYFKFNLAESTDFSKEINLREHNTINKDIEFMIDLINKELDWDDMYTIEDVKKRLDDGVVYHMLYENDVPMAIRWLYDVRPNVYGFNGFISKKRSDGISHKLFEQSNRILYNKGYTTLAGYCDDWNLKIINRLNKIGGFQLISVHMFKDIIGAAKKKIYF